jgi:2-methylcitrate dehydratase
MGCPAALSAPRWGFQDVVLRGRELRLARPLGSYVAENVLFKVAFPAEFHGQTAVEAAFALHPRVIGRLDEVVEVAIATQESAVRIIDKKGPLSSPADRDHCLQYMVAVALLHGELRTGHYRDEAAADPRIDRLRQLTTVREEPRYTEEYRDPTKRAIGNRVQVRFKDGSATPAVEVRYPLGHPRRRAAAWPLLRNKFAGNVAGRFTPSGAAAIGRLWDEPRRTDQLRVDQFVDCFTSELSDENGDAASR